MNIKITADVPVAKEYGIIIGRVFNVLRRNERNGRGTDGFWIMGDNNQEVLMLRRECRIEPPEHPEEISDD